MRTWREVDGIADMLDFVRGKEVEESFGGEAYFTDGSAIKCELEQRGFEGSDVTPPEPLTAIWYVSTSAAPARAGAGAGETTTGDRT